MIKIIRWITRSFRLYFYRNTSSHHVKCEVVQPVLFTGLGEISIYSDVIFGTVKSPYFYSGYSHVEARRPESAIKIGKSTIINNNATIICDGELVSIGERCLIGHSLEILDSDFHGVDVDSRRGQNNVNKGDVIIHDNVFIGNNVTILKGVVIGENSVVANASVVTKSIPENVVAGGNPAKVIKRI
ncbi:acyltransferase [Vibrio splendidus]|uniref:acyltransferase n=1 Tax=Vibrio splendidus TaxID=29497 RepID=UPI001FB1F90C|nr:acyltransferase [Vibrio splendidus]UOE85841.1 acyltransferase [Vibrio splendidus]